MKTTYSYALAQDRGGVVRLVVEEWITTSAGKLRAAATPTIYTWKNRGEPLAEAEEITRTLNDTCVDEPLTGLLSADTPRVFSRGETRPTLSAWEIADQIAAEGLRS
jgi:hypothetical protein